MTLRPTEQASQATVGGLLREQARIRPLAPAVEDGTRQWTYDAFNRRVNRLASALAARGMARGDRVAMLSENRVEYVELEFAAAKLGAMVAALNWRLAADELDYCLRLAEPKITLVSPRFADTLATIAVGVGEVIALGDPYETLLATGREDEPPEQAEPEDGLVILYTSGTTGRPKGAVVSQRAFLHRVLVFCADYGLSRDEAFLAWAPMFHMASTDLSIGSLLIGGRVIQVDGFDLDAICPILEAQRVSWFALIPGVVDLMIARMIERPFTPKGIRVMGAMADLIPRHQIAEVSRLLKAPYLNSFGSTETGIPPASAAMFAPGELPRSLSKTQSSYCEIRLVDADDKEVPDGEPGELAIRGPTLFSGYWRAEETNARDFRGGWFHLGDMFRRNGDGTIDFVDRAKYMIKSGGENIYPAEIERVLLEDARVDDAVVVRRADRKWGEVPVAVIARNDPSLVAEELVKRCREKLAGYKQPKDYRFIALEDFPRSTTGKIQRHEVEAWLDTQKDPKA